MIIINVWTGTGRLAKDPEIKYFGKNETCSATFPVACRKKYHRDGEPDADFFEIRCIGKTAEFCEKYLKKGIKIEIHGRLEQSLWTTKDGEKKSRVTIFAEDIEFAESKATSAQNTQQTASEKPKEKEPTAKSEEFMNVSDDDMPELPFS